jgi:alkanesulfonate monooxygenase SsuD/methylene tetrahydromethanopterin reductase-like flavin-dependent oxidoreductase (luciferase family)
VFQAALRYASTAEHSGFDDLWVTEHHSIPYGVNPSALTFAGHLLGRTTRVRVRTAVVLLPQLPPVFVAEQAALLDHLSGGRFDLGVGRGGPVADLLVAGRGFDDWAHGYWPAIDLLRRSWSGSAKADTGLYRFP